MTHTVDDTSAATGRPDLHAVVEQATGVLIFRYSIGAEAAASLMQLWAAEAGVPPAAVARAIVHDICQGLPGTGSDPRLVRWVEDRLRQEVSLADMEAADRARSDGAADAGPEADPVSPEAPEPVLVAVDHAEVSLDAVAEAARRAARLGVALRITADPGSYGDSGEAARAHLARRVHLATELARALEPDLEVLLPEESRGHGG